MASSEPLQGSELIDCSRANSNQGIETAALRCGYGEDIARYEQALQKAGEGIGVDIQGFQDLVDVSQNEDSDSGVVVAPYTQNQL
jgi:hypothetical protein